MKNKFRYMGFVLFWIILIPVFCQESVELPKLTQSIPRHIAPSLLLPSMYKIGPTIPGLHQGAIPQGLAYSKDHNIFLISHYFEKKLPSCLSAISEKSGKLVASKVLMESDIVFHFGHVGGVAVDSNFIWVASGEHVYQYKLDDLFKEKFRNIVPLSKYKLETKASFCTYNNGILWVGEFVYGKKYTAKSSHHLKDRKGINKYAWICGYEINKKIAIPKYILSIRQKVQGIYITDKFIFLSVSFGRKNRSTIVVYKNPLAEVPHKKVTIDKTLVPVWFLDGENWIRSIDTPPMSQEITGIGSKFAVLTESGAEKYQKGGMGSVDNIILIDTDL